MARRAPPSALPLTTMEGLPGLAPAGAAAVDHDTLYRAVRSRDRRFEGRFVVAVTSTGIYCRPGCPARTPLYKNTRFYRHPAAAESAGFRACARCRPDHAVWVGTSGTVKRALQLIDAGAV